MILTLRTIEGIALAGLPLLYYMHFDFNPINLRNPKVESIATFLDLRRDPNTGANAVNVLAPNEQAARAVEAKLAALPEVSAQYRAHLNALGGTSDALVYSAFEIDAAGLANLGDVLQIFAQTHARRAQQCADRRRLINFLRILI